MCAKRYKPEELITKLGGAEVLLECPPFRADSPA